MTRGLAGPAASSTRLQSFSVGGSGAANTTSSSSSLIATLSAICQQLVPISFSGQMSPRASQSPQLSLGLGLVASAVSEARERPLFD